MQQSKVYVELALEKVPCDMGEVANWLACTLEDDGVTDVTVWPNAQSLAAEKLAGAPTGFVFNADGKGPVMVRFESDEPQSKSHDVIAALHESGLAFGEWLANNADPHFVKKMLLPLKVEYPELF